MMINLPGRPAAPFSPRGSGSRSRDNPPHTAHLSTASRPCNYRESCGGSRQQDSATHVTSGLATRALLYTTTKDRQDARDGLGLRGRLACRLSHRPHERLEGGRGPYRRPSSQQGTHLARRSSTRRWPGAGRSPAWPRLRWCRWALSRSAEFGRVGHLLGAGGASVQG
jgi:hypothetical protein